MEKIKKLLCMVLSLQLALSGAYVFTPSPVGEVFASPITNYENKVLGNWDFAVASNGETVTANEAVSGKVLDSTLVNTEAEISGTPVYAVYDGVNEGGDGYAINTTNGSLSFSSQKSKDTLNRSEDFTVWARVKPTVGSGKQIIFERTGQFSVYLNDSGKLEFNVNGYGDVLGANAATLAAGSWHEVGFTLSSAKMALGPEDATVNPEANSLTVYLDGYAVKAVYSDANVSTDGVFRIGGGDNGANTFKGLIDQVSVIEGILSQQKMLELSGAPVVNALPDPITYFDFGYDKNGKRVANGEAMGQLFDASGNQYYGARADSQLPTGNVVSNPIYATYAIPSGREDMDGFALRTNEVDSQYPNGGAIWFGWTSQHKRRADFSVFARVMITSEKTTAGESDQTLFAMPGGWTIKRNGSKKLVLVARGKPDADTGAVLNTGEWYDIALTVEGEESNYTMKVLVNGDIVYQQSGTENLADSDFLHVGCIGGGRIKANALFDKLVYYPSAVPDRSFAKMAGKQVSNVNLPKAIFDYQFSKLSNGNVPTSSDQMLKDTLYDFSGNNIRGNVESRNDQHSYYSQYTVTDELAAMGHDGYGWTTGGVEKLWFGDRDNAAYTASSDLSAWVRFRVDGKGPEDMEYIFGRLGGWAIRRDSNGKLNLDGFAGLPTPAVTLENGKWYDIGFTCEGTMGDSDKDIIKLYINGDLVASTEASMSLSSDVIHIGGSGGPGQRFNGTYSRVAMFDGIINPADMAALSGKVAYKTFPNKVGEWNFDKKSDGNVPVSGEVVSNNLYDASGRGHNGDMFGNGFPQYATYNTAEGGDGYAIHVDAGDEMDGVETSGKGNFWFPGAPEMKKSEDFSVYTRFKILEEKTTTKEQVIVGNPNENNGWLLTRDANGKLQLQANGYGKVWENGGPSIAVGTWYDIAVAFGPFDGEKAVVKVYLNGELIGGKTVAEACDFSQSDMLHIAGAGGGSRRANALFDTIIYYDGEISAKHAAILAGDTSIEEDEDFYTPLKYKVVEGNFIGTLIDNRNRLIANGGIKLRSEWSKLFRSVSKDFPKEVRRIAGVYSGNFSEWFGAVDNTIERAILDKIISGVNNQELVNEYEALKAGTDNGTILYTDARWMTLLMNSIEAKRTTDIQPLVNYSNEWIYVKHFNMGGSHYAYTEAVSDDTGGTLGEERNFRPGSALIKYNVTTGVETVLLSDPDGVIRDPDVSFDSSKILFSWKKTLDSDDYHIYEMDMATGDVTQLTFGLGYADIEPIYLPDGNIMFNSSRDIQVVDCWKTPVSNIYVMAADGSNIRRVGYDQVHTNYPTLMEDGRILYTRWDYNDRAQLFTQPLFVMNPDGTNQTEFYGNTSYNPTTLLHARQIPGTTKVIATAPGHHTLQQGKIVVIDPNIARNENDTAIKNEAVEFVGVSATEKEELTNLINTQHIDEFGIDGPQFKYPYPINENQFIVSFAPGGIVGDRFTDTHFGLYFMNTDGSYTELITDETTSINHAVPFKDRRTFIRPSMVDFKKDTGTYYMQDIYEGQGLEGVARGTIDRLRIVALEFRPVAIGASAGGGAGGAGLVSTPVSIGNGSWDVKRVIGEVPVYEDGSALFTAPARTPIFFQALDKNGNMVQTMRSWSTLQPGETFSCVGCHENKNSAPIMTGTPTMAMKAGATNPTELYEGSSKDGFSFMKQIQPILDAKCISCHDNREKADKMIILDSSVYGKFPEGMTDMGIANKTVLLPYRSSVKFINNDISGTDWTKDGFDDSAWQTGVPGQSWTQSSTVLLRSTFSLDQATYNAIKNGTKLLYATADFDDGATVFINGVKIGRGTGDTEITLKAGYDIIDTLKVGANTIAARITDSGGGRYADISVFVAEKAASVGNPFSLKGSNDPASEDAHIDRDSHRVYAKSFLTLTNAVANPTGSMVALTTSGKYVNWISAFSGADMLPPYSGGASCSELIKVLDYDVNHKNILTDHEKRMMRAWIDLVIPYCGNYDENTFWTPYGNAEFYRVMDKRINIEREENNGIIDMIKGINGSLANGAPAAVKEVRLHNAVTGVSVKWEYAPRATAYNVYRKEGSGDYSLIAENIVGYSYVDESAENGKTYTYAVSGVNEGGEGIKSGEYDITVQRIEDTISIIYGGTQNSDIPINREFIYELKNEGTQYAEAPGNQKVTLNMNNVSMLKRWDAAITIKSSAGHEYLKIKLDENMDEVIVFAPGGEYTMYLPYFGSENDLRIYSKDGLSLPFNGTSHVLTAQVATEAEINTYRNVALNPYANTIQGISYPYVTATSENGGSYYTMKNAIDGHTKNDSHGSPETRCWGPNRRDDIVFTLEFGREVQNVDKVGIMIRHDGDHDGTWTSMRLNFSDGTYEDITLAPYSDNLSKGMQYFTFAPRNTKWVKITNMVSGDLNKWNGITEFEVWGAK